MTNLKKSKTTINVGVDVGKEFLDIYIHEKEVHWQEENTEQGVKKILSRLARYNVERLVMEATGRYEFNIAQAAYTKNIPICIVKPLLVRKFAGAMDQLAKTDKIDARVIALFAVKMKPAITPRKSKNLIAIKDLIARRRQLMSLRTQELNRIKIMGKALEVSCKRILRCLNAEVKRMEDKLSKHVEENKFREDLIISAKNLLDELQNFKDKDLANHKEEIRNALLAELADKYFDNHTRIKYSLQNDLQLKSALEVLNNQNEYKKILAIN